jgi:putative Mg2+ transporter-C (MgtC) family protein
VDVLREELLAGLGDTTFLVRVLVRLVIASALGGLLGFERQHEGKAAGIRTHMLVGLGSALFTLVPLQLGMDLGNVGRVIQGIAAGIGFLGAGTILKQTESHEIKGLTTAAGIWLTAAVGVAVGAGRIGIAALSVALALFILYVLGQLEHWFKVGGGRPANEVHNPQERSPAAREHRS